MNFFTKKRIINWFYTLVIGGGLVFGVPAIEQMSAPGRLPTILDETMTLSIFDVGQGDAILAQEGNKQILIDGGPDARVLERLSAAMPKGDRTIDLVILTHPHADHVDGLVPVLDRYEIGRILSTDVSAPTVNFNKWRALIKEKNIPVLNPQQTPTEQVGEMKFDVLAAGTQAGVRYSEHDGNSDGLNDSSIVGRLSFGSRRFLLMGDATTVVEEKLVDAKTDLTADLLKVGHHGSNYSTGESFMNAAAPHYAVISVGAYNSYGNPAWRVMELIKNKAVIGYRTDKNGTVTAVTDGESLQVSAEKIK